MNSMYIAINFIRRVIRERSTLLYFLVFPILAGILATSMAQQKEIEVGILKASEDNRLIQVLEEDQRYKVILLEDVTAEHAIRNNVVDFALEVGNDNLAEEDNLSNLRIYALKDNQDLQVFKGLIEGYILRGEINYDNEAGGFGEGRMVLGFLTMFILMFMASTIGLLLEDRRGKTLMRMFSTPVSEYDITMGTLLGSLVIGMIQILLFLGLTRGILRIQYEVSMLNIYFILLFFLVAATGLALGVAGFITDTEKYSVVSTLIVVPTCLLGGSFFPVTFMPEKMRIISHFLPQKWLMEAYDNLVAGMAIGDVLNNLGILLLFAAVFFTFGLKTLKPSAEEL
ncbi:ABC transporter permease [Alkaliphilus peptidifermentans]|uniref:ABC-2 family transporter protein n=1 Tax=Alkaliphilus peptidifermentans DSM 18978 TaxID=1120976 RepID=A0A1G5K0L7_9FIRM|nr:ABC transporter permease [Alkaliphilus peptidifermentans]SCY93650.1 ABC-2 family transporter protein [Alkaliphilus peptidifermentans DSM 18978]